MSRNEPEGFYRDTDGTLRRQHDVYGGPHDELPAAAGTYDPIPDLAMLLCAAQRQGELGEVIPGVPVWARRVQEALGLPDLALKEEAEVAIRGALAAVKADWHGPECEDEISEENRT